MGKAQEILINKITIDGGTQFRAKTNDARVQEYSELLSESKVWPFDSPCDVFFNGTSYFLVDGFHRYHAAQQSGRKKLTCNVINGSLREAIKFALSANARHGLYRSNEDKRKAVSFALADEEWSKLSNRAVAEMCGVGESLVRTIREESAALKTHLEEKRTGKDGKSYPASKQTETQEITEDFSEINDPGYDDCGSEDEIHQEEKTPSVAKKTKKKSLVEEALDNAHHIQPVIKLLNQLLHVIESVPEVPGTELFIARRRKIKQMIEPAKGAIIATKPFAICPSCKGKCCAQCGNHGWVSSTANRQLVG